jgi:hypothetical protein
MRIRTITAAVALALAALASPAAAAAERGTFDISGEVLATCESGTYVTHGYLDYTMTEVVSGGGTTMFNIVLTATNVTVTDEDGATYRLRGTDHFRFRLGPDGRESMMGRHMFQIVSDDGGVVERFNVGGRLHNGQTVIWDIGTCRWP